MQHVILETNPIWLGVCMCDLGVYTICCGVMFFFDLAKLIIERIATRISVVLYFILLTDVVEYQTSL